MILGLYTIVVLRNRDSVYAKLFLDADEVCTVCDDTIPDSAASPTRTKRAVASTRVQCEGHAIYY